MLLGFWSPKEKDLCLLTLVMSENDIIYLVSLEERELIQSFRSEGDLGPLLLQFALVCWYSSGCRVQLQFVVMEVVWRTHHSLLGKDRDKCLRKGRKEVPTCMLACYEVKVQPTPSSNEPYPAIN